MIISTLLTDRAFVSTWKTDNAGSSTTTQITIPTSSSGSYACTVDWGDGKTDFITTSNDAKWTHTYSIAGTYTVKIYGKFVGFVFNNSGDKLKLLKILKWGPDFRLGTNQGAYFHGCSNLTITATDYLNLEGTTNFSSLFRDCTSIVTIPNLDLWDTSAVTNMSYMFFNCTGFNQSVSKLKTVAVTNMRGMFYGCSIFNQSVSSFNTTLVTDISFMFYGCLVFNQSLANFNTGNVTDISYMFSGAIAFNQPVSSFTTSKVTNMTATFFGCTAFNQDVSGWSIAALTNATTMFTNSGFAKINYDKLLDNLTGWPSRTIIQSNVAFSAGSAHYSAGAPTTGRAYLTGTKLWTITDGGTP